MLMFHFRVHFIWDLVTLKRLIFTPLTFKCIKEIFVLRKLHLWNILHSRNKYLYFERRGRIYVQKLIWSFVTKHYRYNIGKLSLDKQLWDEEISLAISDYVSLTSTRRIVNGTLKSCERLPKVVRFIYIVILHRWIITRLKLLMS